MDAGSILEIEGLITNFYTASGVVRVLDGVNLAIKRGETLGLVGESGCGKSVTANSIMRLVPSPPGKVEGGRILFAPSPGLKAGFERLMDLEAANGGRGEAAKARSEYESALASSEQPISGPIDAYRRYREIEKRKGRDDGEVIKLREEHVRSLGEINLLDLERRDLQRIRGKAISMIFQEPMSSLNPVFTAGDQIGEVLLLHEKADLTRSVLESLDRQEAALRAHKQVGMEEDQNDALRRSDHRAKADRDLQRCPGGSSFRPRPAPLSLLKIRVYKRLYARQRDDPDDALLWLMSKLPLLRRYERPLRHEADQRAIALLRLVRVPDPVNVASSYPHEMSGGMQQRVMIAMALACKPQLLIADEPTTALDVTVQAQILKLMRDLQEEMGTTILMITHNLGVVAETCDRVGVMYAGSIVELTSTVEMFKGPLHPYTRGLLAAIPKIGKELTRLETIEGSVPNLIDPPSGCRFHPRCPCAMDVCSAEKPPMREVRPGHQVACHLYRGEGA